MKRKRLLRGNENAVKHGGYRQLRHLDGRTREAKILREIEAALVTDQSVSSYPQPMLRDQLNYLSGNSRRADQKPAEDMYERLHILISELEAHKVRLQRLMRMVA